VVTFSPPVASWSFPDAAYDLDALWKELIQGSSALALENMEAPFDAEMQQKMRVRILSILLYWQSQGRVVFDAPKEQPSL
jgi:hypothetical protein